MKNLITFLLYCLSVTALIAQARSEVRLQVLQQSATETTLRLTLSGVDQAGVQTPHGTAQLIGIQGGTPMLQKGAPDLPKLATALLIPNQGNMVVEIESAEFDDFQNVDVAPSKGNLKRTIDPATVPYACGAAYQRDQFFPGALAELQTPFILRARRGQALWIYPVQYNPVQKTLRVYRSLTLRVHPDGSTGKNELAGGPVRPESRTFDQLYGQLFINAGRSVADRGGSGTPDKMLVLVKDELLDALQPLVYWKRQMGIHTTVVPLSAIGSPDAASIHNFVQTYYAENGITYLLLVGDENAIEPEMRQDGAAYACDNCFGYLAGDDHYPEVLVGRLHASTPEQLRIMVNRNLEYEKHPLVDSTANWCATGMASCSNQGDGIGDDGQADWQQGNEWKSTHLAAGFEKYWEFYDGSHADASPTPGDATADAPGDPANGPLVDLMNTRGVSLYNYTGHGWEQGLVSGNFTTDAVAQLRNAHRYPILIAVACCAGNFTNGECLGETWQRAGDPVSGEAWGGIAGFFSSDFQSWSPPMEGQDGMNQYLATADGISLSPTMAGMLAYGNAKMMTAYGGNGELMADFWNPFAEPTTAPRTRLPAALSAAHATSIPFKTSSLLVTCPVEGALVSLSSPDQTLAVAVIENGMAELDFDPINQVAPLTVTVSQFNYIPYQGGVEVQAPAQAYVAAQTFTVDDAAGNNNHKADFGEPVNLIAQLQNIGQVSATSVQAVLSSTDPYVTISQKTVSLGDLVSAATAPASFPLQVSDAVPNGHWATFTLQLLYGNGQEATYTTSLQLHAPVLGVSIWTLDDTALGNGNGRLESGETAKIRFTNVNTGGSISPAGVGELLSTSPYLAIDGPVPADPMAAVTGQTGTSFQITVAANTPPGALAMLQYKLTAGQYHTEYTVEPLVLNPQVETFETHNFATFPWQMGGNKPWTTTTVGPYKGKTCARSGTITHLQKSIMRIVLNSSDSGIIAFARRVSSEAGYDFLRFYIDSVEVGSWSGEVPWSEVWYPVAAGAHTFTWSYEKDDLNSSGSDRAWVDDVLLPPHQIVVGTNTTEARTFAIQITPNPSAGPALLSINSEQEQQIRIRVFDNSGKQIPVDGLPVWAPAGLLRTPLDFSSVAAGTYWIQVMGKQDSGTIIFLKK